MTYAQEYKNRNSIFCYPLLYIIRYVAKEKKNDEKKKYVSGARGFGTVPFVQYVLLFPIQTRHAFHFSLWRPLSTTQKTGHR